MLFLWYISCRADSLSRYRALIPVPVSLFCLGLSLLPFTFPKQQKVCTQYILTAKAYRCHESARIPDQSNIPRKKRFNIWFIWWIIKGAPETCCAKSFPKVQVAYRPVNSYTLHFGIQFNFKKPSFLEYVSQEWVHVFCSFSLLTHRKTLFMMILRVVRQFRMVSFNRK